MATQVAIAGKRRRHHRDISRQGCSGGVWRAVLPSHIHRRGNRLLPGPCTPTRKPIRRQGGGDEGLGHRHTRRPMAGHRGRQGTRPGAGHPTARNGPGESRAHRSRRSSCFALTLPGLCSRMCGGRKCARQPHPARELGVKASVDPRRREGLKRQWRATAGRSRRESMIAGERCARWPSLYRWIRSGGWTT